MNLLFASFDLGDLIWETILIFFFIIWIWIFIAIVMDLFRDHEIGGWHKAAWLFFLIVIPFFSAFIYLIARGHGMQERTIKQAAEMQKAQEAYIRDVSGGGTADELSKLHDLKEKGAISQEEYDKAKAKIVG